MTDSITIIDEAARQQALLPQESFIIQAPAGSGKTELLVRRFLTLLAYAETPESILAITFTRKAAAEMRERILLALQQAASILDPAALTILPMTQQLAYQALQQDRSHHWQLLDCPQRLRIFTIDALCSHLVRQMPLSAQLGASPETLENAEECYVAAAKTLLAHLETDPSLAPPLKRLLLHLDNDYQQITQLFVSMLARRDQWLSHLLRNADSASQRQQLERSLCNIVIDCLNNCMQQMPTDIAEELITLARYAANNITGDNQSCITACADLQTVPSPTLENLDKWKGLAELLLTAEFTWRKSININQGFPAGNGTSKIYKKRMETLLKRLESEKIWRQSLQDLLQAPPYRYTEQQWTVIADLVVLLRALVAELMLVFREKNAVDFVAVSTAALRALGDLEEPTELALRLDYQIQHILVDEFQDTSITQFRLLESLTTGWQLGDGRTLFLVGDPMQSIYRFREAEVGLFIRAQQHGIGQLRLQPLTLRANFRAQSALVDWINNTFVNLFPSQPSIASGAVTYSSSVAAINEHYLPAVICHPFISENEITQSQRIANIVREIRQTSPQQRIAILVRSRSHLADIVTELKMAGIHFQGIEIETLSHYPIIQDLLALTRAMLHFADRIAWLAILRAPWCGLTLTDLHTLANFQLQQPLWYSLLSWPQIPQLSADARQRLARIVPILQQHIAERRRSPLTQWLKMIWSELGGAACVTTEQGHYADVFFELLQEVTPAGGVPDIELLEKRLEKIYAPPDHLADGLLQIMTIHKAKGLEFDVVILPRLEAKLVNDKDRLLWWMERPSESGDSDLILAPIKAATSEKDALCTYLRLQEKNKVEFETIRLLYVAATRAKCQLHLLGTLKVNEKDPEKSAPMSGTFLGLLWPILMPEFAPLLQEYQRSVTTINANFQETQPPVLTRVSATWQLPSYHDYAPNIPVVSGNDNLSDKVSILENESLTTAVGTVVHYWLQKFSYDGLLQWSKAQLAELKPLWRKQLMQHNLLLHQLSPGISYIEQCLQQVLEDPRAQWILQPHAEAVSEYALTAIIAGHVRHLVIDRTFVCDNVRWIIDYKTTPLNQEDPAKFLMAQRQEHQPQLQVYAEAMQLIDSRPIRLGLYFPAFGGWQEWDFIG